MITTTELKMMQQLAQGKHKVAEIAEALQKSVQQVHLMANKLTAEGLIERKRGFVEPIRETRVNLLLQLLLENPGLAAVLSDAGIPMLTALLKQQTIKELSKSKLLEKSMLYRRLKKAMQMSIIRKEKIYYRFNEQLWPKLKAFLLLHQQYQESVDKRVPAEAVIYHKSAGQILFSLQSPYKATLTAFSVFEGYGIKLLLPKQYYFLPEKQLSLKEIFVHALQITDKETSIRHLIFLALFYLKFKKELQGVKHTLLKNLKQAIEGNRIEGYPTFADIKEKAEVYGIKMKRGTT